MDKKILLGLVFAAALIAIVAMAGLAEAKEISITKIRPDRGNTKSAPYLGVRLVSSPSFEVKEFESIANIFNRDLSGTTIAVITISANNSIVYVYNCVRTSETEYTCEDYPLGYATPNAPFKLMKYLTIGGQPGSAVHYKLLVNSYGDLNHPYYGVNVTACHYTEPENCNSEYVQGKYSGYEIG